MPSISASAIATTKPKLVALKAEQWHPAPNALSIANTRKWIVLIARSQRALSETLKWNNDQSR